MEDWFILIFRNTHEVIKADEILDKANVKREIIPTPKFISSECGLSIKVWKDIESIIKILEKNPPLKIFNSSFKERWTAPRQKI